LGNLFAVYRMDWEESERGWGVRPDGYSLHLTLNDWNKFYVEFISTQPKDYVPDEYTRTSWEVPKLVEVTEKVYNEVLANKKKHGKWYL